MTHYVNHSDDILVELSLLGDQAAFEELVMRHERAVLGTALKVTENHFSAQDASQDAFVSAWINLDQLKSREKFGPWVCSIAKNKARTLLVHYRSAIPDLSLDLLKNVSSQDENDTLWEMLGLSQDDSAEMLRAAVDSLSEKIRQAVRLHYFEGLSIAEIAKTLSLPAGTVKWRLSEGRKQLRKEYGLMEHTYDDNESILTRVMRQVEQLKLWRLKEDKTGFEKEYRQVLQAVEELEESKEKQHALADTLMTGYWWLPGERNDTVLARMKEAALQGHNEDVMQCVIANEHDKYKGAKRIQFVQETQIPWLEEKGFPKTLAYVYFWLGVTYMDDDKHDECIQAYEKAVGLLTPEDVYYANALAALECEKKRQSLGISEEQIFYSATGEVYKYIDGKLYFWTQPGYSRGGLAFSNDALFWNASRFGNLIYDPDMKVGDVVTAENGNKLTFREKGATIHTPAGTFEGCSIYAFEGNAYGLTYCETAFCPNVGIVQQKVIWGNTNIWKLESYTVQGGTGLLPFAAGNKWSYKTNSPEGMLFETENVFEITYATEDSATVKAHCFCQLKAYENSWRGNMLQARNEYAVKITNDHYKLVDVSQPLARAAKLAATKREKVHTAIATNVMERIFATDPATNPNYTEKGLWNFFQIHPVVATDGKIRLEDDRTYDFEWKDIPIKGNEAWKILYNFLYDILCDAAGCVWDDAWVPGYHIDKKIDQRGDSLHLIFDVLEDECVSTSAGEFTDCRHISLSLTGKGRGYGYRGGKMDYWFAPNIGIVKFSRPYGKDNALDCIWELTRYEGTGEGYFPIDDGLFRRYEPTVLGDGYHAWVEYTFDQDESGTVLFRNALGTQDRTNYEAEKAKQENK